MDGKVELSSESSFPGQSKGGQVILDKDPGQHFSGAFCPMCEVEYAEEEFANV
jgi:hypothetical protein